MGEIGTTSANESAQGPGWERLEAQLRWYSTKSGSAKKAYMRVKVVQIVLGATIPIVALGSAPAVVAAILGGAIVVLEGVQQLYQWQTNWVLYRSTAEALKHERYLFLASAGPYRGADRNRVLAERVEGLVSQEHAKWTDARPTKEEGRAA